MKRKRPSRPPSIGMPFLLCMALALPLPSAAAAAPTAPQAAATEGGPVASASASRTVIHVGDVFEYRVTVQHSSAVSFVTQELERTLVVRPFELRSVRTLQRPWGQGQVLEVVLSLATFEKPAKLEIPAFSLFYYPAEVSGRRDQGPASRKDIPARELVVPAYPIVLQSTLLGSEDRLRDSVTLLTFRRREMLLPAAAALLLLSLFGWLGWSGVRRLIRRSQPKTEIDQEQLRRDTLDALRGLQRKSADQTKQPALFLEVSATLRRYLSARFGVNVQALTPEEARVALEEKSAGPKFARQVEELLAGCDEGFFNRKSVPITNPAVLCEQGVSLLKQGSGDIK